MPGEARVRRIKAKRRRSMDPEINAMSKVAEALEELEDDARNRVLKWATDRYNVKDINQKSLLDGSGSTGDGDPNGENSTSEEYETFAELFAEASPSILAEKVLVAGYWHQVVCGESHITSASLNIDLKDLGHAVKNISEKFDALKGMKPQLAIQLKKTGTNKQGRKQYKITKSGIDKVKEMLGKNND